MRYPTFGFLPIWWIKNSMSAEFWFAFLFWVRLSIFSRAQELSVFHFLWIIYFAYFSGGFGKLFIWRILPPLPRSLTWVENTPWSSLLFLLCFLKFLISVVKFSIFYGFWIFVPRKYSPVQSWEGFSLFFLWVLLWFHFKHLNLRSI